MHWRSYDSWGELIVGMGDMSIQSLPVMGEVFMFLESIVEMVDDPDVIIATVSASYSIYVGGKSITRK